MEKIEVKRETLHLCKKLKIVTVAWLNKSCGPIFRALTQRYRYYCLQQPCTGLQMARGFTGMVLGEGHGLGKTSRKRCQQ